MHIQTPYYLIDELQLLRNLEKIQQVRESAGAKSVLALKCFSTWAVFDLMKKYMDGTTSSSLYEARLGHEQFGKEVHAYSVAWSDADIKAVQQFATKIIFNSVSQLKMFYDQVKGQKIGLRVNPQMSYSDFDLADPARKYSRLGVTDQAALSEVSSLVSGAMFHYNCENADFDQYAAMLDKISDQYQGLLKKWEWVSLGGGIYFTKEGYPLDRFCQKLRDFSEKHELQVYLEPGESAITRSACLVTKVLDIVHNEKDIAIVDSSIEAHMLDLLIYRADAKMDNHGTGRFDYMVAGKSCLAGDVFGTFRFDEPLTVGSEIRFTDAAGYTMVKKNWFNGVQMPSIVVKRLNGKYDIAKQFDYQDFKNSLS